MKREAFGFSLKAQFDESRNQRKQAKQTNSYNREKGEGSQLCSRLVEECGEERRSQEEDRDPWNSQIEIYLKEIYLQISLEREREKKRE